MTMGMRAPASGADDAAVVAAGLGVVDVDVARGGAFEESHDRGSKVAALNDISADQHRVGVVGAEGKEAVVEHLRDLAGPRHDRSRVLADEDGASAAVGRTHVVMGERDEQNGLPHFRVGQTDAAGRAGLFINRHAADAAGTEFGVGKRKEWSEEIGGQRAESEGGHGEV